VESSQRVINEIEAGLRSWRERSRGDNSPQLERREAEGGRRRAMTFHGPVRLFAYININNINNIFICD